MNLWLQELSQSFEQLDTRAKLLEALDIIEDQAKTLNEDEQAAAGQLVMELNRRLDELPG